YRTRAVNIFFRSAKYVPCSGYPAVSHGPTFHLLAARADAEAAGLVVRRTDGLFAGAIAGRVSTGSMEIRILDKSDSRVLRSFGNRPAIIRCSSLTCASIARPINLAA